MKKFQKIAIAFYLLSILVSMISPVVNIGFISFFVAIGLLLTGLIILIVGLFLELNRGDNK